MFMLTAALFLVAKKWKQPKGPPIDEWINEMWCVHRMEYNLVTKSMKY